MSTIVDRLQIALSDKKMSWSKASTTIGLSPQAPAKWKKGQISKETLDKLATLLEVDVGWLLSGNGEAAPSNQSKPRDGQPIEDVKVRGVEFWDSETPLDDDEFEVPYYKDVELTGGCGSFEQHDDGRRRIKYGKTAAYASGASQTQSICMTLVGDSMEDLIRAGSMIAVDLGKKEIREGKIYAFRHGQLLRVKYLIPKPDGGLIIRSHNKSYEDEHITAEEVENDLNMIGWVWNWSVLERW
ncbi:XRE family transcriptional regulator [Acinetobacter bereziniae]|uniref:XRE family transcriptional regulator n=1 Tax=Acinetobacter bereziniae TaxID=106648 RepID=UPI00300BE56D